MSTMATRPKCLVLTRAGLDHRLGALFGTSPDDRSWDLAISQYQSLPAADLQHAEVVHFHEGGKWDGIYQFFKDHPDTLDEYGYFWLVDDDIEATPAQTDRLFSMVFEHGFELAQPSLTPDSYNSYRITVRCPGFRFRNTNFVELMMPVLSVELLRKVLPLFEGNRSGRGIDWAWHRYVTGGYRGIAIIDEIAFAHKRPLRRHLHGRMRDAGVCPEDERRSNFAMLDIKGFAPVALHGMLVEGRLVDGRFSTLYRMLRGYWASRAEIRSPSWGLLDYLELCLNQVIDRSARQGGVAR